jgi:hypothetical protein
MIFKKDQWISRERRKSIGEIMDNNEECEREI